MSFSAGRVLFSKSRPEIRRASTSNAHALHPLIRVTELGSPPNRCGHSWPAGDRVYPRKLLAADAVWRRSGPRRTDHRFVVDRGLKLDHIHHIVHRLHIHHIVPRLTRLTRPVCGVGRRRALPRTSGLYLVATLSVHGHRALRNRVDSGYLRNRSWQPPPCARYIRRSFGHDVRRCGRGRLFRTARRSLELDALLARRRCTQRLRVWMD